ncbi:hypothetical protein CALVIDRAFT_534506 [Calocera viscosa TUFC12733]|uniref:EF-hand n=1 Tax=Calocera viscosa (strain TUFC12733) TaxID=1330018 RepID=A0A167Q856_CALVF|nr:hypothetical protein CALVIDRAFT_534506 [Calocera viscosa TUFC12733]
MSNPTFSPEELAFTNQVLALADPNNLGIVPGDVAVNVFAGSNIPADTLGDIWQIADSENNGFLTRKGLGVALRLMSHVQFGEKVDESLASKPAPPPTIKGITPLPVKPSTPVPAQRSVPATPTPRPVPPIPTRPSTIYAPTSTFPPITAEDRAKFTRIFAQSGPVGGLLSGEKARDVFLKSKLPVDTLGQIWALADTQSRGALDLTDFILGMYFIQSTMNKSLSSLPSTLPAELYEQASGGRVRVASPAPISPISRQATGQQPVAVHHTGGSFHGAPSPGFVSHFPPASPAAVQRTGSISRVTPIPTGSSISSPWAAHHQAPSVSAPWDITPAEKATADQYFASLDKVNNGYITGDIAVPFMLDSKLPESALAQIWDLADLDNAGQLDRDGFAVAMHLIKGQLAGKELPSTLPLSLVPPSKRVAAPVQAPPRPVDDLFSLFDDPPAPPPAPQPAPPRLVSPPIASAPRQISAPAPAVRQPLPDLLGDDDVSEPAPPVPDRSAEVGNLQNQLASTQRSVEKSKADRAPLEKQVADYASQIAQLESQLAVAKAAHDAETQLLSNVRTRSAEQTEQMRTLKEDLIRAESDLSALRLEKTEIETALLRDKEDVRDMQKKMKAISDDTDKVKAELEKAKNDARLQKGLVAIAKKQLATAEAENAKALEALAATQMEIEEAKRQTKEAEEAAAAIVASIPEPALQAPSAASPAHQILSPSLERSMAIPLPETPEPSVTPSIMSPKSNNPFDRLTREMSFGPTTPRSTISIQPAPVAASSEPPAHDADVSTSVEADALEEVEVAPAVVEAGPASPPSGEHDEDDPFGVGTEPATSGPLADEAVSSFDDIFGSSNAGDIAVDPSGAPAAQVEEATSHRSLAAPTIDVADSDNGKQSFAVEQAEVQFPALDVAQPPGEELPPLREVETNDDDSSDDEFQSAPQTARSAVEPGTPLGTSASIHTDSTPTPPSDLAGTMAVELTSTSPEAGTPKASEHRAVPDLAPAIDDDFFGSGFVPAANAAVSSPGHSVALNDFDEAMGQMPISEATVGSFQFDSAFGDRTAHNTAVPSLSATPTNGTLGPTRSVNGRSPPISGAPPPTSAGDDFDSVFPDVGLNGSAVTQSSTAPSLSFDDAFVIPALASPAQPSRTESTRSIFAANMPSPMTPPRKTASKNKGLILNPNMPAVFHSELAPPPTQRAEGATTPALPDDVDAVKQLCGMGFTRSQAVEALEKYGYDVSKALNSLLR